MPFSATHVFLILVRLFFITAALRKKINSFLPCVSAVPTAKCESAPKLTTGGPPQLIFHYNSGLIKVWQRFLEATEIFRCELNIYLHIVSSFSLFVRIQIV